MVRVELCGSRIKLRLNTEVPIQVDGEPWIQPACEVNILRSALKATMLRKIKMKRRNTEPSINHELERESQEARNRHEERILFINIVDSKKVSLFTALAPWPQNN